MHTVTNAAFILLGTFVIYLALVHAAQLRPQLVKTEFTTTWQWLINLTRFFFAAYWAAFALVVIGEIRYLNTITSFVFAVGGIFVFFTVRAAVKITDSLLAELSNLKNLDAALKKSVSLLKAVIESTADGILVVDQSGKIVHSNEKFTQMWNLPESIMTAGEDAKAIAFVLEQLKSPEKFLKKVGELYEQPHETSYDTIEFKDGKLFERISQPQMLGDACVGRVWSFRDVTERNNLETERRKLL